MEKDTESMAKGISCTETESIDTEIKSSTICIPDHDRCHNDNTVGEILQKYDWHELESKFEEAMTGHCQAEELLQKETSSLLETFIAWSQVTSSRDEERSFKRFKTRVQHVQNSEYRLDEKRNHYSNVVRAFESALALLK